MSARNRFGITIVVVAAVSGATGRASAVAIEALAVGGQHACATFNGKLGWSGVSIAMVCWGANTFGQASSPGIGFQVMTAGGDHTCGLNGRRAICWGDNRDGETNVPADNDFTMVSAGAFFTCGTHTDGTPACWGKNDVGQSSPPNELFRQVSAGGSIACGVTFNLTLACWGDNSFGIANVPTSSSPLWLGGRRGRT
jgi:hypothetical protein